VNDSARVLVLITAGGTGGHVYPALAVAVELQQRGYDVQWVGTHHGIESRVVPANGITLHALSARGMRGKGLLDKLLAMVAVVGGLLQALLLIHRLAPGCVVGMGGYAAGPAAAAAWLLRVPLIIHEQNAVAGTTNRLLAPLASRIFAGFDNAFDKRTDVTTVGNPVREQLIHKALEAPWDYHGGRPLRLLVVGGSLGSQPINEVLPETLKQLQHTLGATALEVYHQSGEMHLDKLQHGYGELLQGPVRIEPYIEDMAAAYAWADLVLCRAGALTVSELTIMGRPALLVPLPHAIGDHQTENALSLTRSGGALLLRQRTLEPQLLAETLVNCIADPAKLASMAAAATRQARPQATADICQAVQEVCPHA